MAIQFNYYWSFPIDEVLQHIFFMGVDAYPHMHLICLTDFR